MKIVRYIVLFLLVLVSGCIKVDQSLTIRRDGSAIFDVTYSLSEQAIVQMKAAQKLEKEMAKVMEEEYEERAEDDFIKMLFDPNEDEFRKKLKEYKRYGLKIERMRVNSKNAWRNVQMRLLIKNMAVFAKSDIFTQYGFSIRKDGQGNYMLMRGGNPELKEKAPDFTDPRIVNELEPILSDFKVLLRLNTPNKLIRSNATRSSAYRAEWIYEFSRDPSSVHRLHTEGQIAVFDGAGLALPEVYQVALPEEEKETEKKPAPEKK